MTSCPHAPTAASRRRFLKVVAAHSAALLAAGGFSRLAAAARPQSRLIRWQGIALGTGVSIELFSDDIAAAQEALKACRLEIQRLEAIFSLYDARSAVGRLNRDGVLPAAPAELIELIRLAEGFSESTDGAFDITIQPLVELLQAKRGAASDAEIAAALALVDHRGIACDGTSIRFARRGMCITLNGVAQGYITDRVADQLRGRGFDHTLIDLGEKRALGAHPEGRPWGIGIESPCAAGTLAGSLELADRALATSGGYSEVFTAGGRHHLLDARTGSSHQTLASISVLAPRAVVADALSTCLGVCEASRAQSILANFPAVEGWVIDAGTRTLRRIG
ncbi:MAG TPA: FAD:protein FMN transferase [Opitutaceae bacterium]